MRRKPLGEIEMRRAALAFALGLACCAGAWAAQPAPLGPPIEPPMQVHLVRSAEPGCEPQCPEWIAAQGRIEPGSLARFKRVLRQLGGRKVPVLIDSGGGRVHEALAIGRLARARGLDVVVSRTELEPCPPGEAACHRAKAGRVRLGVPRAELAMCASSCAFILAGGRRRMVGPSAFVGVHQIRSFHIYAKVLRTYRIAPTGRQVVSERTVTEKIVETRTPKRTYDQVRRYFAEMGIGKEIMPLILSTPGDRLYWLTPADLKATGLATHWIEGGQVLAGIAEPAAAAPAAPPPGNGEPREDGLGALTGEAARPETEVAPR
jgi:hypothetical protein